MITRRRFVARSLMTAALTGLSSTLSLSRAFAQSAAKTLSGKREIQSVEPDLAQYVDVMTGTGGTGHTYPAAAVPFGAVQVGPDTGQNNWAHSSGYHYSDSKLLGFSHTHLTGTGCGDLLDFLITPGFKNIPAKHKFSHADEKTEPGYYSVLLRDHGIQAEMTATERAALHRYQFPAGDKSLLQLDLNHGYDRKTPLWAQLNVVGNDTLVGGHCTDAWAKKRQIYFAMKVSKPFKSFEIYDDGELVDQSTRAVKDRNLKVALRFATAAGEPLLVKVGLSSVSADGALKNLNQEIPDWNFERVRAEASSAWQKQLSTIQVETKDLAQKKNLYTALYHAMLAPTLFDDVDGKYRGMDGAVHQLPAGARNYTTFSLWDTFRALHPLFTLIQPARVPDLVNTLIRMSNESPKGPAVWPLQGYETNCMTGYHSSSVIAEAGAKGFKGIDYAKAYAPFRNRAFDDNYNGLPYYRKLGFIPAEKEAESVSKVMELAYDDWAVAHLAQQVGASADAKLLTQRSLNFKNHFDAKTGFMRPRSEDGAWTSPFDPTDIGHVGNRRDYTEANGWQTTFHVLHDPRGLIESFGGNAPFIAKLDQLFNSKEKMGPHVPPDATGLIGQYAHGNEPGHHIAYLYAYAGAPYKTQQRVQQIMKTLYKTGPEGLPGNEDCGQMSAWFIMSSLGFYSVDPVSGNYVFGSPLFDRVELKVSAKNQFVVEANRRSADDIYIQSVTLNGQPHTKSWIRHSDIAAGGRLVFNMGPQPNMSYGANPASYPPSLSDKKTA